MALNTPIVSLLIAVLGRILGDEFKDSAPELCKKMISFAVKKLPEDQAAECAEEWQSFVNDRPGNLNKVRSSVGFIIAAYRIRWSLPNGLWQRLGDRWEVLRLSAKAWSLRSARTALFFLPGGAILGIFYGYLNSNGGPVSASSTYLWCGAGLGVLLLIVIRRGLRQMPSIRTAASSCVMAAMFAGVLLQDYQQSASRLALSFDWARSKTESLAFSALEQRLNTGAFPEYRNVSNIADPNHFSAKLSNLSANHATYTVKVPDLPGEIIADLNDDGGEIRWQEGRKVLKQVHLLRGVVREVVMENQLSSRIVLFEDGREYRLPEGLSVAPQLGSEVVAVVDPETATISHYQTASRVHNFIFR